MFNVFKQVDEQFLSMRPEELSKKYQDISLIHLEKGSSARTFVVSVLIHGNEKSSFKILQGFLAYLQSSGLDYSLLILLGNLSGTKDSMRHLKCQPDFNRIWIDPPAKYRDRVLHALQYIRGLNPYCLIDLHNNTGSNPPYACISTLDKKSIGLASLFSGSVVYFPKKLGLLIDETAGDFPSVVFECGVSMDPKPIDLAIRFLKQVIHQPWSYEELHRLGESVKPQKTVGRFLIIGASSKETIGFELASNIESKNFKGFLSGDEFAKGPKVSSIRYVADSGEDLTSEIFICEGESLRFKKNVYPCMLTTNLDVALSDCIGYLLEEV